MIKVFLNRLFFGLLFCPFLLLCQEITPLSSDETMKVNSGEAQYDGKEIVLIGEVVVQHGLGQISSRRLSLIPSSSDGKKNKFAFLTISDNVEIELQGGARLYCQKAEVDYSKLQGIFGGNEQFPDVVYLNAGEENKSPHVEIKSRQMILDLIRESAVPPAPSKTLVSRVQAIQDVRVNYNQNYFLVADQAHYQRLPVAEPSLIAGLLTLSMDEESQLPCRLSTAQGDAMQASRIEVDTLNRTLSFEKAAGILYPQQEKGPPQKLEFAANEIVWNDKDHSLHLDGNVNLLQNDTFQLYTDHSLTLSQTVVEGKKTLRAIEALEQTTLSYKDPHKGEEHKIRCPGRLFMDHEKQEMILCGLQEETDKQNQVSLEDILGEMYADRVTVNYLWKEKHLQPANIVLEGHVRLLNQFGGHVNESGSMLHYALADRIEYSPEKQEMTLICNKGNRVLLFDKVNNVQMSAPSLTIRRDTETGKEIIQGLGDVRFSFVEKEIEQLNKFFLLQKISKQESNDVK